MSLTCPCDEAPSPQEPHVCIVKVGFTGVYIIFLISALKHRLCVPVKRSGTSEYLQSIYTEQKLYM